MQDSQIVPDTQQSKPVQSDFISQRIFYRRDQFNY